MPRFEFTSPEGKKYTVAGPEGATKEQAFQVLQSQIAAGTAQAAAPAGDPRMAGVPGYDMAGAPSVQPARPADPTFAQKLIGGGETALALATGATTGAVGMLAGGAAGLVGNLTGGRFGMKDGVEAGMQQGAESLTYSPRTEAGQDYTQAAGEVLQPLMGLPSGVLLDAGAAAASGARGARNVAAAPVAAAKAGATAGAEAAASTVGQAAATAAKTTVNAAAGAVEKIRTASPKIAARVERTLRRNPEPDAPTPGTQGSAGAAGVDMAAQRNALADSLPVPVELTAGEATRDPMQIRFENESGKQEVGQPLRDRAIESNRKIDQNFDNFIDKTQAVTTDASEAGRSTVSALRNSASRDKGEIRKAYNDANASPEAQAPVRLGSVVDFLNENRADETVSPLLTAARKRAIQLGVASEASDGTLLPAETTVQNAERFRRAIGNATDYDATNVRNAAAMKGLIDMQTESVAGPLFRSARRLRENYAKKYENRAIVSDLLENKRGTGDRKVAIENVFKDSILNGDRADLGHLRAALQTAGPDGAQAWRDLQGTTAQWIRDQAFGNSARDAAGGQIASFDKLNKAIQKLEQGKRLDFIFTKQGAQQIRDLAEVTSYVKTAPPGFINTSNTAATILAAIGEAGAAGALIGLPVPILSLLRVLSKHHKNRALQKRIEQALTQGRSRPRPTPQP